MQTLVSHHRDLDHPYPLTTSHIEFYREHGYIKLKNVFRPETLNYYKESISQKVTELSKDTPPLEHRNTYGKAFLQICNLWTQCDIVKEFVFSKRLARIATELMEVDGVRIYHDQALYKEAGGGITPWHADQFYWPVSTDKTCTAWIPLQDTPIEMGPLAFCQGSQKLLFGRDLGIGDESELKLSDALKSYQKNETPFDLGEVSFHSGWTFHRAGSNRSRFPREVMTVIYMDKEMTLMEPKTRSHESDRKNWCPEVKVGSIINSHLNPILYERSHSVTAG